MVTMDKILNWLDDYRKPISYTVGGLNLLNSVIQITIGNIGLAVLWFVIGVFLIWDTWSHR